MNRKTTAILIVALAGLLAWSGSSSGGGSLAQGEGGVAPQAVLTPLLQYQGRLTNPSTGEPVADGNYTMTFRLYDVASGGSALWTETEDVSVQDGLFSTALGDVTALSQSLFNGQALWLGVKVGADTEATPRQQVLPVAYALSLVPGAVVEANSSSPILEVNNTGSGDALQVGGDLNVSGGLTGGSHNHSGADVTSGTVADARVASTIARDSEIVSTVLANDGAGSTLDADLLDGSHASAFAGASHAHDTRYYTEGESDGRFVNATGPDGISGNSPDPILEVVQTGSGAALYVEGPTSLNGDLNVSGNLTGGSHNHDDQYYTEGESDGRFVNATGPDGISGNSLDPILTVAQTGSGEALYVEGLTILNGDLNVSGSLTGGSHNHWGESWAGSGVGLQTGGGSIGFYGGGSSYGGYFWSFSGNGVAGAAQDGTGVYGEATASSGIGVDGQASGGATIAVRGMATDSGAVTNYGGYFEAYGTSGRGVAGGVSGSSGRGVFGFATSSVGTTYGLYGEAVSANGVGVYGYGRYDAGGKFVSYSGNLIEGWEETTMGNGPAQLRFRVTYGGNVYADGTYYCGQSINDGALELDENEISPCLVDDSPADFAEVLPVANDPEPGDVLVIGSDGKLTPCFEPNATNVVGVHSTLPSYIGGAANLGQEGYAPLAVAGIVPAKASAENGSIHPGDLLTTSATLGHAMKASPITVDGVAFYLSGTIVGKALEGLDGGSGVIQILVMLQ